MCDVIDDIIYYNLSLANQRPGLGHVIKNSQSEAIILGNASFGTLCLGLGLGLGLGFGLGLGLWLGGWVKGWPNIYKFTAPKKAFPIYSHVSYKFVKILKTSFHKFLVLLLSKNSKNGIIRI